jgi:glucose/arabinose dehydrogenase
MAFAPDGRLFVLEQGGNVQLVHSDGSLWTALQLNVDFEGERGLLGIAFDPGFASNHFVYLYYTNPNPGAAPWSTGAHNQLSRFTVDDSDPQHPLFTSEAPILDWDTLLPTATNHNGGAIHFGLDGMLYADAGDNTQTFTLNGTTYRVSQTLSDLLGKQLRINVANFNSGLATRDDTTVGHLIPPDNPFVGTAPGIDQLIYNLGLRNPFTFAVQPGTGTIFINDVGDNSFEEIDLSLPGANYGWSGGGTDGFGQSPPGPGFYQDPLLAYPHVGGPAGGGDAIVAGTFYDPPTPQFPLQYVGKYFYADLDGGWIRVFDPANPGTAANPDTSTGFATGVPQGDRGVFLDATGNLYYLTGAGMVERISYVVPQITVQPTNQSVIVGQTATFSVTAIGPSLSYQWQHLAGNTWSNVGPNAPTLSLTAVTPSDAGSYQVIVSNSSGSVTSATVTLSVQPAPPLDSPGMFDPTTALWYLRNSDSAGPPDFTPFAYGAPGWRAVVGHWNGDGSDSIGVVDPATETWYLRNENSAGAPDAGQFAYGAPGWIPVVGDWTGSGHSGIGVFDPRTATWYLRNTPSAGPADVIVRYGAPGWLPVVGDWNGDGTTTLGVVDPTTMTWYLRNDNSPGPADAGTFVYGGVGWTPLAGDFTGTSQAGIAVVDPGGVWYIRTIPSTGTPDLAPFAYGLGGWTPLAGHYTSPATPRRQPVEDSTDPLNGLFANLDT